MPGARAILAISSEACASLTTASSTFARRRFARFERSLMCAYTFTSERMDLTASKADRVRSSGCALGPEVSGRISTAMAC